MFLTAKLSEKATKVSVIEDPKPGARVAMNNKVLIF